RVLPAVGHRRRGRRDGAPRRRAVRAAYAQPERRRHDRMRRRAFRAQQPGRLPRRPRPNGGARRWNRRGRDGAAAMQRAADLRSRIPDNREDRDLKVLITGGCGYVGTKLTEAVLARTAHEVDVLDTMWFGNRLPPHP